MHNAEIVIPNRVKQYGNITICDRFRNDNGSLSLRHRSHICILFIGHTLRCTRLSGIRPRTKDAQRSPRSEPSLIKQIARERSDGITERKDVCFVDNLCSLAE